MAFLSDTVISNFNQRRGEFLNDLKELVKNPSVSFEGFDPTNVKDSAACTAKLMKKHGLENVQVINFKDAHPYVYGEWLNAPGKPMRASTSKIGTAPAEAPFICTKSWRHDRWPLVAGE